MVKLLEFLYKGVTKLGCDKNEEQMFVELLADLEIGGSQCIQIVDKENDINKCEEETSTMDVEEAEDEKLMKKTLKCNICGQILNTATGLRLHLLAHKGSKQWVQFL